MTTNILADTFVLEYVPPVLEYPGLLRARRVDTMVAQARAILGMEA